MMAIFSGVNAGIGLETAKDFARRGARVLLACRNISSANVARQNIIGKIKHFKKRYSECL